MAYEIVYKKRFVNKLFKLLDYLKKEWGEGVSNNFISKFEKRIKTLSEYPTIGIPSSNIKSVRSILLTKHNRLFYRIKDKKIEVINMYDTRSNPTKKPYK